MDHEKSARAPLDGFSLIEMAMLLIIIGLIASAVIPRVVKKTEQEVFREGKGQTRSLRDEIVGFAVENCYLPDNASADMARMHKGSRWTGKTRYRPNTHFLQSYLATQAPKTINSVSPESLLVRTPDGQSSPIAFILVSPGKNGAIETDLSSSPVEIKQYQESGANTYDDVVDYVTVDHLRAMTTGCDKAPILGGGGSGGGDGAVATYKYVMASGAVGGQTLGYAANIKGDMFANGDSSTGTSAYLQGNVTIKGDLSVESWTTITGSVYARGDVTLNSRSYIYGDIHASGNVVLNSGCVVYGNIYCNGSVTTNWPNAYKTTVGGNINALGAVDVAGPVGGNIISGSTVKVSNDHVAGNVDAAGTITVDTSNGYIDGYARSGSTISGTSRIAGTKTQNSPAPPRLTPTPPTGFTVPPTPKASTFTASGADQVVSWNNDLVLAPNTVAGKAVSGAASYGALNLGGKNTLTLSTGNYYFTSITANTQVTLRLNLSGGPINIFVTGAVNLGDRFYVYASSDGTNYVAMTSADKTLASKVYMETHSTVTTNNLGQWFGTIYASDNINFGSSNTIIGSYYTAKALISGSSPTVTYVQADYAKANW